MASWPKFSYILFNIHVDFHRCSFHLVRSNGATSKGDYRLAAQTAFTGGVQRPRSARRGAQFLFCHRPRKSCASGSLLLGVLHVCAPGAGNFLSGISSQEGESEQPRCEDKQTGLLHQTTCLEVPFGGEAVWAPQLMHLGPPVRCQSQAAV